MKTFVWSSSMVLIFFLFLAGLVLPLKAKPVFHWLEKNALFSILSRKKPAGGDAGYGILFQDGIDSLWRKDGGYVRSCGEIWFDLAAEHAGRWSFFQGNPDDRIHWYLVKSIIQEDLKKSFYAVLPKIRISDFLDGFSRHTGIPSIAFYEPFIQNAGFKYHIDPALIRAIIWRESRFNHKALGQKGEIGLMQLLPGEKSAAADWALAHHRSLPSEEDLYDMKLNLEIGAWYLARALNQRYSEYKNAMALALCEYNAGPRRALAWCPENLEESVVELITIPSTRQYVQDILNRYEYYKKQEKQIEQKGFR